jgi:hypothetical protein
MKFKRRTAGYTCLDNKRNLDNMKEFNTQPIMKFIENYRSNWKPTLFECSSPESRFKFSVPTKRIKIFGENLQTLARDCNRPLGLMWKADDDAENDDDYDDGKQINLYINTSKEKQTTINEHTGT